MMPNLVYQRCFNHAQREAAARCPSCGGYFCRECITEHEDRVLCAACLRKLAPKPLMQRTWMALLVRGGQCLAGLVAAWFFFYLIGHALAAIPSNFHEGALWQVHWTDSE
jgi:hypothetical protein